MKWFHLEPACPCTNPPRRPAIRLSSTFADQIRSVLGLVPTATAGTWRCFTCGTVHTITAADLRYASTGKPTTTR